MLSKGIIDRIEGNIAVIEVSCDLFFDIPFILLPIEAQVGDAIEINIEINREVTIKRCEENANLLERILKKSTK